MISRRSALVTRRCWARARSRPRSDCAISPSSFVVMCRLRRPAGKMRAYPKTVPSVLFSRKKYHDKFGRPVIASGAKQLRHPDLPSQHVSSPRKRGSSRGDTTKRRRKATPKNNLIRRFRRRPSCPASSRASGRRRRWLFACVGSGCTGQSQIKSGTRMTNLKAQQLLLAVA